MTTDIKNNVTTRIYDNNQRLDQVISNGKTTKYTYFDNGNRKTVTYFYINASTLPTEEYTYYKDNLLKTLTNKKSDGSVIDTYNYTYDAAHNQTSKTDPKGTTNYAYDELNRLQKVTEPTGKTSEYTYDAAGNRQTETITDAGITTTNLYTYNEQNRLLRVTTSKTDGSTEMANYTYDNNGNMTYTTKNWTEKIDPVNPPKPKFGMMIQGQGTSNNDPDLQKIAGSTVSYEYDGWNQMIKSASGSTTDLCKYNGEGYRVEKTTNGVLTKYLYEADKVVLELDGNGKQTASNVYGNNLVSRTIGADTLYFLYNGHADVTSLIKSDATIVASYYYDAFGTITSQTGTVNNNITYAGYQYDSETGLYYLNARMYDPKIARFLQEDDSSYSDPNDPLSLNLYTYCLDNPFIYDDPTGHTQQEAQNSLNVINGYLNNPYVPDCAKQSMLQSKENLTQQLYGNPVVASMEKSTSHELNMNTQFLEQAMEQARGLLNNTASNDSSETNAPVQTDSIFGNILELARENIINRSIDPGFERTAPKDIDPGFEMPGPINGSVVLHKDTDQIEKLELVIKKAIITVTPKYSMLYTPCYQVKKDFEESYAYADSYYSAYKKKLDDLNSSLNNWKEIFGGLTFYESFSNYINQFSTPLKIGIIIGALFTEPELAVPQIIDLAKDFLNEMGINIIEDHLKNLEIDVISATFQVMFFENTQYKYLIQQGIFGERDSTKRFVKLLNNSLEDAHRLKQTPLITYMEGDIKNIINMNTTGYKAEVSNLYRYLDEIDDICHAKLR